MIRGAGYILLGSFFLGTGESFLLANGFYWGSDEDAWEKGGFCVLNETIGLVYTRIRDRLLSYGRGPI